MSKIDEMKAELEQAVLRAELAETEMRQLRQTKALLQSTLDTTIHSFSKGRLPKQSDSKPFEGVSFIMAYYDIPDQIERTLKSCTPEYQNVHDDQIEVIIVDNGSNIPMHDGIQERYPFVSKIIRVEGKPSPVFGLNQAIGEARFPIVAMMIDGAHMLSPGIVKLTREIYEAFDRPVINVPQYLLGHVSQGLKSREEAYRLEEWFLKRRDWPKNGYALFDFAHRPGEEPLRDYISTPESNCLITTKNVFDDCGAFDERFDEPGAGFANLEIFLRLANHPQNNYVILPGEGSFHQDHDGTTTGKSPQTREAAVQRFKAKYRKIAGNEILLNPRSPFLYGQVRRAVHLIPTISIEFGQQRTKLLRELADIYALRAQAGIEDDNHPMLAVKGTPIERKAFKPLSPLNLVDSEARFETKTTADVSYAGYLAKLHKAVTPNLYFEIGVDTGASMSLSKCRSIGVDPAYHITSNITAPARLFRITSDKFFEDEAQSSRLLRTGIDLSFIDGMHLSEYVLRDFINVEKWCNPEGVIVIDDVLPEQMEMAARDREYNAWCGDVYKLIPALRKYRPDLEVHVFEAFIGPYRKGLAVIKNLDPKNTTLFQNYDQIAADMIGETYNVESIKALEDLVQVTWDTDIEAYISSLSPPNPSVTGIPQPAEAMVTSEA